MSFNIMAGLQRGANVLGALGGLVPVIGALVQSAEGLFPTQGAGAQKLAHVQEILKNVLVFGGNALADVEAIIPVLTLTINNVVAAAKGQPVQPTPPAPAPTP